ncbi:NAD-dependent epimerase/dehydratase family protein [Candidatus Poribacteria bacterium]|nr:NAD-dependent epimerase/dehydratase family protein [Candidatus Poribacteria bacterium]
MGILSQRAPQFSEPQKEAKIFIIGSTGFIGSAIIRRLVKLGFRDLHCLYRSEERREKVFSGIDTSSITFLQGDVSQQEILRRGIDGAAIVLNASGIARDWGDRREFWLVNVEAPKAIVHMIEEMNAPTHYIHITTAAVYGFSTDLAEPLKTESSSLVRSDRLYTASKVEIHSWLRERMSGNPSFPITVLAPTIVWGPGDNAYLPLIKESLRRGKLSRFRDALPVDFIHIYDLVDAILLCFFNERSYNEEYILTGPESFTFERYIEKVAEFASLPPPRREISVRTALMLAGIMEGVARFINLFRPGYRPSMTRLSVLLLTTPLHVSGAKAERELGFRPEIGFADGIESVREYVQRL